MNPTALAMMPMTTNNPTQQSNSATSNSTAKFGDILKIRYQISGDVQNQTLLKRT